MAVVEIDVNDVLTIVSMDEWCGVKHVLDMPLVLVMPVKEHPPIVRRQQRGTLMTGATDDKVGEPARFEEKNGVPVRA